MPTVMWEVRAVDGRIEDLVAYVAAHADPSATVYRSLDQDEPRVVLLDPSGTGLREVPDDLVARPAYSWLFEPVPRG